MLYISNSLPLVQKQLSNVCTFTGSCSHCFVSQDLVKTWPTRLFSRAVGASGTKWCNMFLMIIEVHSQVNIWGEFQQNRRSVFFLISLWTRSVLVFSSHLCAIYFLTVVCTDTIFTALICACQEQPSLKFERSSSITYDNTGPQSTQQNALWARFGNLLQKIYVLLANDILGAKCTPGVD